MYFDLNKLRIDAESSDDEFEDDFWGPGGDPTSLKFQMYGYGGYGYDTSHVKPDDRQPEIIKVVEQNDLKKLREMVDEAKTDESKRLLVNASRRWTEVDYKMSGFTKEWEWHDLTPIAKAANRGHAKIVRYLLELGIADPTLEGCPTDDYSGDAYYMAQHSNAWGGTFSDDRHAQCLRLLDAAKPFWKKGEHSRIHYSTKRVENGFKNSPTDLDALRKALAAVPVEHED